MGEFISKEINNIYLTFLNNDRLQQALDDNYLVLKRENYIGEYATDAGLEEKISTITIINEENLLDLATLCYNNKTKLNDVSTSIESLVENSFLRSEISLIFDGIYIEDITLKEIFFAFKFCQVTSFFQNNRKYFIPEYDAQKIEENPELDSFVDAMLKEFDKLSSILKNIKNITDIDSIEASNISYLSQLLGYESRDVPTLNEEGFRELVKNIIEVYKIKGTNYSFELFFSFLGFSVTIEEFYFDRRKYFSDSDAAAKKIYNNYCTIINPCLNKNSEFLVSENVKFSDIGNQYSLVEFNDLAEEFGPEAVLGYSKLDKNNNLYTGKVYTYFKTNYITYSIRMPDGGSPNTSQIDAIVKYLSFLSPTYILKTIESTKSIPENDNIFFGKFNEEFYFRDLQTGITEDGITSPNTREYIVTAYINKGLGNNTRRNLLFSRNYNYHDSNGNLKLEVGPYPTEVTIQNDFYETIPNTVDLTEIRNTVIANENNNFGIVLDEIITNSEATSVSDYLTLYTTGKELNITKTFKSTFKTIKTVSIIPNLQIFADEAALTTALTTSTFRKKLRRGLLVAVANGTNSWNIKRYGIDKNLIVGKLINGVSSLNGDGASLIFTSLSLAESYLENNFLAFGKKVWISGTKIIYSYEMINYSSAVSPTYVFENYAAWEAYALIHPENIYNNFEFYVKEDSSLYTFIPLYRRKGKKVWFSDLCKLYEFVDGTTDECFMEVPLNGKIEDLPEGYFIIHDGIYPYYDEQEDIDSYIFYNNVHGMRPNIYSSKKNYLLKSDSEIVESINSFFLPFYNNLSDKSKDDLNETFKINSSYSCTTIPDFLENIFLRNEGYTDFAEQQEIINILINYITSLNGYSNNNNYVNILKVLDVFLEYNILKTPVTDFFGEIEFTKELIDWREKYLIDSDPFIYTSGLGARDVVLNKLKASLSFTYGKLNSPINNVSPDSLSKLVNDKYIKEKFPFYDFTNTNGVYTFTIKAVSLDKKFTKQIAVGQTISSDLPVTFLNASFEPIYYRNYKTSINTDFIKISSITRTSDSYIITTATTTNLFNKISNLTDDPQGFLYLNNFKTKVNSTNLIYPNQSYISKESITNEPLEYISFGYDKTIKITIEQPTLEEDILTNDSQLSMSIDSNNLAIEVIDLELDLNNLKEAKKIEIEYIPQEVRMVFSCGNSVVNNDDVVFIFNCGDSSTIADVLIDCGGA